MLPHRPPETGRHSRHICRNHGAGQQLHALAPLAVKVHSTLRSVRCVHVACATQGHKVEATGPPLGQLKAGQVAVKVPGCNVQRYAFADVGRCGEAACLCLRMCQARFNVSISRCTPVAHAAFAHPLTVCLRLASMKPGSSIILAAAALFDATWNKHICDSLLQDTLGKSVRRAEVTIVTCDDHMR